MQSYEKATTANKNGKFENEIISITIKDKKGEFIFNEDEDVSKVIVEKSQSWQNVLTTFTSNCNQKIKFNKLEISLNNVTYVQGFSQTQYLLMKLSGMTGMLGNKIFLNNSLYIDCTENKIGIE